MGAGTTGGDPVKLVIEVDDSHMPFVRQQARLHGPVVRLNFEHFPALLPGRVTGTLAEAGMADREWLKIEPLEG